MNPARLLDARLSVVGVIVLAVLIVGVPDPANAQEIVKVHPYQTYTNYPGYPGDSLSAAIEAAIDMTIRPLAI